MAKNIKQNKISIDEPVVQIPKEKMKTAHLESKFESFYPFRNFLFS